MLGGPDDGHDRLGQPGPADTPFQPRLEPSKYATGSASSVSTGTSGVP